MRSCVSPEALSFVEQLAVSRARALAKAVVSDVVCFVQPRIRRVPSVFSGDQLEATAGNVLELADLFSVEQFRLVQTIPGTIFILFAHAFTVSAIGRKGFLGIQREKCPLKS